MSQEIFWQILKNRVVNFDEILVESEDSYGNCEKMGKYLNIFKVQKNFEENLEKFEKCYNNFEKKGKY